MERGMASNVRDRKRMGLKKAILSLLVEWIEFEDDFDSSPIPSSQQLLNHLQGDAQGSRQGRLKEGLEKNQENLSQNPIMHEKLKEIDLNNGSSENNHQVEILKNPIHEKLKEIDWSNGDEYKERWERLVCKEKEVGRIEVLCEEKLKEIEGKMKEVDFSRNFIEERAKELELKQKELDQGFRDLELKKLESTINPNKSASADMAHSKLSHREPPPHLRNESPAVRESRAFQNAIPNAPDYFVTNLKHQQPAEPNQSNSSQTLYTICLSCNTNFQYPKDSCNGVLCCPSCSKKSAVIDLSSQSPASQTHKGKPSAPCSTLDQSALSQQRRMPKYEAVKLGASGAGEFPLASIENEKNHTPEIKKSKEAPNANCPIISDAILKTRGREYQRSSVSAEERLAPSDAVIPRKLKGLRCTKRRRRRDINLGFDSVGGFCNRSGSSGPDPKTIADKIITKVMSELDKTHIPSNDEDGSLSPKRRSKKSRICSDRMEDQDQELGHVEVDLCNPAGVPPSADQCEGKFKLISKLNLTNLPNLDYNVADEPECSNFVKGCQGKSFSVDQIWACYDCIDAMPRFYAKIRKVESPEKIQITWLEPEPEGQNDIDWVKTGLPVGCGKFLCTSTVETLSHLCLSHQIHARELDAHQYVIYPRKGETWAIFKDWNITWKSDPKIHEQFQFEIVEVISDFNKRTGVKFAPLAKANGSVSLFQRTIQVGMPYSRISCCEFLRFSHQVPSFRLNGSEEDGVPKVSFELDPASLPASLSETSSPEKMIKSRDSMTRSCKGRVIPTMDSKNKLKTAKKFVGVKPVSNPKMRSSRSLRSRTRKIVDCSPCSAQKETAKKLNGFKDQKFADLGTSKLHASSGGSPSNISKNLIYSPDISTDTLSLKVFHDFSMDKYITKFKPGEFWALYSGKDDNSRNYVQIQKVEPSLMLVHAALLESTQPMPASCGMFRVGKEEPEIFFPRSFSHKVKVKSFPNNRYAICPWKGEIWAMHKSWNDKSSGFVLKDCMFDIVEVLKCNKDNIEVSNLIPHVGFNFVFKAPSGLVCYTDVRKILWSEISLFSHRIPAFQHTGGHGNQLAGYLELDPGALPESMFC